MKKFPKPWFRPQRGLWYVTLEGKQYNLGPDKAEALLRYAKLLTEPAHRECPSDALVAIIDAFLEWVQRHRSSETYLWYQYRLERFAKRYRDLPAANVRPFHVQQWVDGYTLSVTSRRNYLRAVKRCFSWATKQGYLDKNPVAALEIPAGEHRETIVSQAEFDSLLSHLRDQSFRDLLIVTWETGCRPQESLRVEARHVDQENQRWIFGKVEAKGKKAARVVYLTDTAFRICRKLVEQYPEGKIFRNSEGGAWTTEAVNCAFARIRIRIGKEVMRQRQLTVTENEVAAFAEALKKTRVVKGREVEKRPAQLRQEARRKLTNQLALKLVPNWSLYTLRHTWATRALQKGVDPLTTAILMGHSDPSMLSKVYQHLSLHPGHMLEQAKKAVQ